MHKLIFSFFLVGLISGCASLEKARDRAVGHLDEKTAKVSEASKNMNKQEATPEQEAKIGRESAAMLLGASPLVQSKEVLQYVNAIGGWIALQTGHPGINWRFGVLNSPGVNAFAAPDGYIFLTRGLFSRLRNESELAGVLAHEIAHVIKRHYIIALKKKDESGALANLASAAVEVVGIKGDAVSPVFNLAQNIYSSGLDKADEYEADALGMIYAARAGYEPFGLPRVLAMYAENSGGEGFELMFATHPSPQDRLKEISKSVGDKLNLYEKTGLNDNPQFQKISSLLANEKGNSSSVPAKLKRKEVQ